MPAIFAIACSRETSGGFRDIVIEIGGNPLRLPREAPDTTAPTAAAIEAHMNGLAADVLNAHAVQAATDAAAGVIVPIYEEFKLLRVGQRDIHRPAALRAIVAEMWAELDDLRAAGGLDPRTNAARLSAVQGRVSA